MTSLQSSALLLITIVSFPKFLLKICKSLSTFAFLTFDIIKIISILNPNKHHGQNMIINRICDESDCKPLGIIFRSYLEIGTFPLRMEKKPMWFLSFKTKISKSKRTIAPFLNYMFQTKYLKGYCMTLCSSFSLKIV